MRIINREVRRATKVNRKEQMEEQRETDTKGVWKRKKKHETALPCEDILGNVEDLIAGFVGFVSASRDGRHCTRSR